MENDTPAPAAPSPVPAASPAPARSSEQALSDAKKVEELADQLSTCADSIHERIMRDIRRHGGKEVPPVEQAAARELLDAEMELRQRADRLYTDAAACIVSSLGQPQQHLMRLTADAAVKIQNIARIGDGIGLVARLLGLAAAATTGHATPILGAIERLKTQLDLVALHNPTAPASSEPPASA